MPDRRRRPAHTPRQPPRPPAAPRRRRQPPAPSPRSRAIALGALGAGVLLIVAVAATLLLSGSDEDSAQERLDAFLAAWSGGADSSAARLTTAPSRAAAELRANRAGLDGARLSASVDGAVEQQGDRATARVRMSWDVPEIGAFGYTTRVVLRETPAGGWLVRWTPAVVHPQLDARSRLGTVRNRPARGRLLDRDGTALVEERPVKRIGVIAGQVDDPETTAQAFADALEIDPEPYARAIRNGGRQQFVEAITLRPEAYAEVEGSVTSIPGAQVLDATAQLAPTRAFGRAVLGDVRELSAEQLRRLGGEYAIGDVGGQWGLEAAFERALAGTPDRAVVVRVDGAPTRTLTRHRGTPSSDVTTTLDADVQAAAEQALGDREERAALVAVQPSSGDVLAVANRPVDDSFDRALEGRYPPGSTFKIVTTDALLEAGAVTPETVVDCPTTTAVGGREFTNFEGGGDGEEPFADAFAASCNTAFVALADRLAPRALTQAGRRFGIGRRLELPLPAYGGQVPPARDVASRAAAMIGQDRVLASPLGMAAAMAAVADGSWRQPRLVEDDPRHAGDPLDAAAVDQLRDLTRQVVTSGTGTALAYLPGEPHGKSGTAEHGSGDPPPTHAWFVAYRDDVAVAVLVEGGAAGGEVAAPIAEDFFSALDAGVTPESLAEAGLGG